MLNWGSDRAQIADRVALVFTNYKVLLKTLDDPEMLQMWLEHHLPLVGAERIIIADNGSTDERVLEIYRSLPSTVTVFRYQGNVNNGFHNVVHDRGLFRDLYAALAQSCNHSIFIDTDEFIYPVDIATRQWSGELLDEMLEDAQGRAIPTVWVYGAPGWRDITYVGDCMQRFIDGYAWSKPFVPTGYQEPGFRIHNVQFPKSLYAVKPGNFIALLHLNKYSRLQRLSANKRKLIARGVVTADTSFEEIARLDVSKSRDPAVVRLVKEVETLQSETTEDFDDQKLPSDCLRFYKDGKLSFSDERASGSFVDVGKTAGALVDEAFAQNSEYSGVGTPERMQPHMSEQEREMLARHLRAKTFLMEFGCGGSTVLAAECGIPRIASVESDKAFLEEVRNQPALAEVRLTLVHADIGPTGQWGAPIGHEHAFKWPSYYLNVWKSIEDRPDVVFVDGRFRVACFLNALVNCEGGTTLIIHDYWNRPNYHAVGKYCDCIDRIGTMGVFKAKPDLDWRALAGDLIAFGLDYR
ncbi:glycosyltransferase family 2 protein [Methylorubrum sp. B1-46]|uniref:glycosyltransferase family 2 protein n=1 Tax=Methylorubrum sp. B1-46 TaxID=2897334 RepID=UPI001E38163B|nr:glycosyltransferase family 2 protein [Methylorubrum sp. B1-46]UGB24875.1 glycosyltransferase family 2 protein [Methylorubrum sp. B1-46]